MYNNIVIYIVGHGAEDAGLSPNEMHIFQCVNVSARDVVEDLKSFKQGRYRSGIHLYNCPESYYNYMTFAGWQTSLPRYLPMT